MKSLIIIMTLLASCELFAEPTLINEINAGLSTQSGFTLDSQHIYFNRSNSDETQVFNVKSGKEILSFDSGRSCQSRSITLVDVNENDGTAIIGECCENYGRTSCQYSLFDTTKGAVVSEYEINGFEMQISYDRNKKFLKSASDSRYFEYDFQTSREKTVYDIDSFNEVVFLSDSLNILVSNTQTGNGKITLKSWPDRLTLAEIASTAAFHGRFKKMFVLGNRYLVFYENYSGRVFEVLDLKMQKSILTTIGLKIIEPDVNSNEVIFYKKIAYGYALSKLNPKLEKIEEVTSFDHIGSIGNQSFMYEITSASVLNNGTGLSLSAAKGWNSNYLAGVFDYKSNSVTFTESQCAVGNFSFFKPSKDGQFYLCFDEKKVSWWKFQ